MRVESWLQVMAGSSHPGFASSATVGKPTSATNSRIIGSQSHGIGTAVVAKRYRVARRAILSHAQSCWRDPYGESQFTIGQWTFDRAAPTVHGRGVGVQNSICACNRRWIELTE